MIFKKIILEAVATTPVQGHYNDDAEKHLKENLHDTITAFVLDDNKEKATRKLLEDLNWHKNKSKKKDFDEVVEKIINILEANAQVMTVEDKVDQLIQLKNLNINHDNSSDGYSDVKDRFLSLKKADQKYYVTELNISFIERMGIRQPKIKQHFEKELSNNKDFTLRLLMQGENSSLTDNKKWIINNGIIVPYSTFLIRGVFGSDYNPLKAIGGWMFSVTGNKYIDSVLSTEIMKMVSNKNPVLYTYFIENFGVDYKTKLDDFFNNSPFTFYYDKIKDTPLIRTEAHNHQFKTFTTDEVIQEGWANGFGIMDGVRRFRLLQQVTKIFGFKPALNDIIYQNFKDVAAHKIKLANNDVSDVTDIIIISIMEYLSIRIRKFANGSGDNVLKSIGFKLAVSLSDPTTYKVWDNNLRTKMVNYIEKKKQEFEKQSKTKK